MNAPRLLCCLLSVTLLSSCAKHLALQPRYGRPVIPTVKISGHVQQPCTIYWHPSLTAREAIARAGGLGSFADERRVFVQSRLPNGNKVTSVINLYDKGHDTPLLEGAEIMVTEKTVIF